MRFLEKLGFSKNPTESNKVEVGEKVPTLIDTLKSLPKKGGQDVGEIIAPYVSSSGLDKINDALRAVNSRFEIVIDNDGKYITRII